MIFRTLIISSFIFILSGCGLSPSKAPQSHYYRLANALPVAANHQAWKVAPVQASGIYNERAILYRQADRPLEIHRYHYHLWTQTPAKLVQQYMQQALQKNTTKFAGVIKTEIIRFERLVDEGQASADIALRITTQQGAKIYEARVKAADKTMHASVEAFGKAMGQIMQQLEGNLSR